MRSLVTVLLLLCLFTIPARADELTGRDEALEAKLCEAWKKNLAMLYGNDTPTPSLDGNTPYWGCVIKRGGDTEELIAQKDHWELAIVSARDVDLQCLADEGILHPNPRYFPQWSTEKHQWLHRDLWHLWPQDSTKTYQIFVYERTNDDVTLLLCNGSSSRKRNSNAPSYAMTYLGLRSAEHMRGTDGLAYWPQTTSDMLLAADPSSWDMASLVIPVDDRLTALDEAGLLLDLRQDAYLAQRQPLIRTRVNPKALPAGVFADDGRLLALPCSAASLDRNGNATHVHALVINPHSQYVDAALAYAVHIIRSEEWAWFWQDERHQPSAPALDRNDMTW